MQILLGLDTSAPVSEPGRLRRSGVSADYASTPSAAQLDSHPDAEPLRGRFSTVEPFRLQVEPYYVFLCSALPCPYFKPRLFREVYDYVVRGCHGSISNSY